MPPTACMRCQAGRAIIKRPKNYHKLCRECFITVFEDEIHHTIVSSKLFYAGEKVAIGASGGKDSTVLASVLKTLNERHQYGLELILLSVDEGIKGYRDDSLETVKRNALQYDMPLKIVGYDQLYGWTMDQVVDTIGKKGNCTYCGVFRRQALDRGAKLLNLKHVVTGHNADDIAETVLMNLLRGDLPRLSRSTGIVTGDSKSDVKRSKPLKYAYEKEIVLYAHHKKLDYFSTECIYSPEAFRGTARSLLKNLERVRPSAILDIVRSGEDLARLSPHTAPDKCCSDDLPIAGGCGSSSTWSPKKESSQTQRTSRVESAKSVSSVMLDLTDAQSLEAKGKTSMAGELAKQTRQITLQSRGQCVRCGYMSSQQVCQACALVESLNKNRPDFPI